MQVNGDFQSVDVCFDLGCLPSELLSSKCLLKFRGQQCARRSLCQSKRFLFRSKSRVEFLAGCGCRLLIDVPSNPALASSVVLLVPDFLFVAVGFETLLQSWIHCSRLHEQMFLKNFTSTDDGPIQVIPPIPRMPRMITTTTTNMNIAPITIITLVCGSWFLRSWHSCSPWCCLC